MFGCMQVNSPSDEQMRNTLIEMQPQNYQLIWRWLRVYNVSAFRVNYSLSALLMQGLKCRTGYCGLDFWRLNPWNIHLKGNQYGGREFKCTATPANRKNTQWKLNKSPWKPENNTISQNPTKMFLGRRRWTKEQLLKWKKAKHTKDSLRCV